MSEATSRKREIIAVLAVLIVIAVIATTAIISANQKTDDTSTSVADTTDGQQAAPEATASTTAAADTATTYKDGTYTATGSYNSPGGGEEISVSVTLANGVITGTTAENEATNKTAQEYQDQFISAYSDLVVGKSVAEVNLSRVSGSSLTSQGFNDALSQIRQQASS